MKKIDTFFAKYLRGDRTIWIIFFILCLFSVIELYSASSTLAYKASRHTAPIIRHVTFLVIGGMLTFFVHLLPTKLFKYLAYLGLIISIFLLVFVFFKGTQANDAKRWIKIFGIGFQPSDLAKISLVIFAADYISKIKQNPLLEKKYFTQLIVVSAIIVGLIFVENFSTAAILGTTIFAMMFIGKISTKKLLSIAGVIFSVMLIVFLLVKVVPTDKMPSALHRAETWVSRIENKASENDNRYEINDANLQVQHSRIAIARGGFFGVFPGNSVERDYLPHAYDDFIFSIILEEMGFAGGFFVMLLYLVLLFRTGRIANVSKSNFSAILVAGVGMLIVLQALVNILVGSGFGLVTGQPLPLISRGGTSILMTCVNFGIILGIIREIKKEDKKSRLDSEKIVEVENIEDEEAVGIENI